MVDSLELNVLPFNYWPRRVVLQGGSFFIKGIYHFSLKYINMNWYKKAQFTYKGDEERTEISSPYGSVIITETTPRYEFVDDLTPEEFERVGIDEDDFIAKIEHIEVNSAYRGQGYGTALMKEAMKELSKRNINYIYLNAY